jgi:hypothetical protein
VGARPRTKRLPIKVYIDYIYNNTCYNDFVRLRMLDSGVREPFQASQHEAIAAITEEVICWRVHHGSAFLGRCQVEQVPQNRMPMSHIQAIVEEIRVFC